MGVRHVLVRAVRASRATAARLDARRRLPCRSSLSKQIFSSNGAFGGGVPRRRPDPSLVVPTHGRPARASAPDPRGAALAAPLVARLRAAQPALRRARRHGPLPRGLRRDDSPRRRHAGDLLAPRLLPSGILSCPRDEQPTPHRASRPPRAAWPRSRWRPSSRPSGSTPRETTARMLVLPDGSTVGTIGGGKFESLVIADARKLLDSHGLPFTRDYDFVPTGEGSFGAVCGGTATVLLEVVERAPRLLVVGAGHCGRALARAARFTGWDVTVADERSEQLDPAAFPEGRAARAGEGRLLGSARSRLRATRSPSSRAAT